MKLPLDLGVGASIDDIFAEKEGGWCINLGPFKYYVIKIFTLLDPTQPTESKSKFWILCYNVIIWPTPLTQQPSRLRNVWMVPH